LAISGGISSRMACCSSAWRFCHARRTASTGIFSPFTVAAATLTVDSKRMPQKMKTTAMAPRKTMANQPVILSRICCSMTRG
jgi:hypothetical protein